MSRNKYLLSDVLQRRYRAQTHVDLARRVAGQLASSGPEAETWTRYMEQQRFWPAGNTLLAGSGEPIRPNCCVLPAVSESNLEETVERARNLWAARIGIGFDLSMAYDPVAVLRRLSAENARIPLGHRPQRGNMAVLAASHPRARAFCTAKANTADADGIYNFNISLSVDSEREWRQAQPVVRAAAGAAWQSGDPGLVFLDRIRNGAPYDYAAMAREYGPLTTVVPCGEQGMHAGESCTLAAVNLHADAHWDEAGRLQRDALSRTVGEAVRLLNATLDQLDFAGDTQLQQVASRLRRVGLGVMGWADVLRERLGVAYDSAEARTAAAEIGQIYSRASHIASDRNITVTCMQPTGGITLLTGNRGFGIEPDYRDAVRLEPRAHLEAVAAWQPYVDNAISKTVNLAPDATPQDVLDTFHAARALGLKLVCVYRSGSRDAQPMNLGCRDAGAATSSSSCAF